MSVSTTTLGLVGRKVNVGAASVARHSDEKTRVLPAYYTESTCSSHGQSTLSTPSTGTTRPAIKKETRVQERLPSSGVAESKEQAVHPSGTLSPSLLKKKEEETEEERARRFQVRKQCGLDRKYYGVKKVRHRPIVPVVSTMHESARRLLEEHILVSDEQIRTIHELKQGTPEWRRGRQYRLGGSNFAAAVGHGYGGNLEAKEALVTEMITPTFEGNAATRRGQELEGDARTILLRNQQARVLESIRQAREKGQQYIWYQYRRFRIPKDVDRWPPERVYNITEHGSLICKQFPWLASSTDGDIWLFGVKIGIIEIKCPSNNKIYPITPLYYFDQIQGNMWVHKVGFCLFVTYIEQSSDDAKLQVDHYEYDENYCTHFLLPMLHKFYFETFIPRLLHHLAAQKSPRPASSDEKDTEPGDLAFDTPEPASSVKDQKKEEKEKKKEEKPFRLDLSATREVPCTQKTPMGEIEGRMILLGQQDKHGKKRRRQEHIADFGWSDAMGDPRAFLDE